MFGSKAPSDIFVYTQLSYTNIHNIQTYTPLIFKTYIYFTTDVLRLHHKLECMNFDLPRHQIQVSHRTTIITNLPGWCQGTGSTTGGTGIWSYQRLPVGDDAVRVVGLVAQVNGELAEADWKLAG